MTPFQNMNLFQNANVAARFFIFAGLALGIVDAVKLRDAGGFSLPNQWVSVILLSIFIILFNVKATIDDHHYFEESWEVHVSFKYLGFVLAVLSWIFCGVASILVYMPTDSIEMLGLSMVISTVWLLVHLIEITIDRNKRNREVIISLLRQKWAMINVMYLICFIIFLGWVSPVIPPHRWWIIAILLMVLGLDILTSYPIKSRTQA